MNRDRIEKELNGFKEYVIKSSQYINALVTEVEILKQKVEALEGKSEEVSSPPTESELDEFYGLKEEQNA